jgi:1,4-dihydroxy-2-naphthoate octaprenyltransferase
MVTGATKFKNTTPLKKVRPLFPRILVAMRPWSFPAALSPLLITYTLMSVQGNISLFHAIVFGIGILALQASANLLNSFCDYRNGLDKFETSGDRTIVDELVTKSEFPWLFTKLNLIWFLSFISTIPADGETRSVYLWIYAAGVLLAVFYSAGSVPLKYIGLGDLCVFLSFGPLLVTAGAYCSCIDTSRLSIETILLLTSPAAILVVAILHANNHRDLLVDAKNKAKTVSVRLGDRLSFYYYVLLLLSPVVLSIWAGFFVARGAFAGILISPMSWRLIKLVEIRENIPRDIDAETAKVMLVYGLVTSIGIALV